MKDDPDRDDREFVVRNLQRRHKVDARGLKSFVAEAASSVGAGNRTATLALVGDARIRQLNRDFRGYDKPTDVLSFAADSSFEPTYLGDIVISVETANRQSQRRRSNLKRELKVLALHGLLHLLGYDHETDEGEMRRVEYRLRRRFGITTPRAAAN